MSNLARVMLHKVESTRDLFIRPAAVPNCHKANENAHLITMSFNFASFSPPRRKRKVVDIAGRKSVAGNGKNG